MNTNRKSGWYVENPNGVDTLATSVYYNGELVCILCPNYGPIKEFILWV